MKIKLPLVRRSGFSLVEVTIASGITAVALTTLLGLIPAGLTNIKEAGDVAAESRITTHLFGTVGQARWQNAAGQDLLGPAFDRQRYYFDDQGVPLETSTEKNAPAPVNLAYVAELTVAPRDVALPADAQAAIEESPFDPYLRRVTVKVASVANPDFNFDRVLPVAYRSHTTLIARTGH